MDFYPFNNAWWLLQVKRLHSLPENIYFNQTSAFKTLQRNLVIFGLITPFLLQKKALNLLNFHISLPLKRPFVATLSETHALTSRKYVAEDTKSNPDNSNLMNYFGSIPPFLLQNFSVGNANFPYFFNFKICLVGNRLKMLIFEIRLPLKKPFLATFDETRAPTYKKSVVVQGMSIPKSIQKYKLLWSYSSVLVLE